MIDSLGIIGVGHLASYLVEGLKLANPGLEIVLSPRNTEKAHELAAQYDLTVATSNQAVVDKVELLLLTTRAKDIPPVLSGLQLNNRHVLICTAAVTSLEDLQKYTIPATVVRAMPLSCAAIRMSPTLICPKDARAIELFEMLGQVQVVDTEEQFVRLSTIAGFYGWIFALLDQTVSWVVLDGVSKEVARNLVLQTVRGASELGLAKPQQELATILNALATPGGITRQGLRLLEEREALSAWSEALELIFARLKENDV